MKKLFVVLISTLMLGCASIPDNVETYRKTLAYTKVDEHQLAYLDRGPATGPVILLLHGLPTSSYLYRNVIEALVVKGNRVIAPDFLGFGASDKPAEAAQYDMAAQARRTLMLLDQLKVSKANLVVHDMGGPVAWEMLGMQPRRFERILVMNTTAYSEGFDPPFEMKMLGGMFGGVMAGMMESSAVGPVMTRKFIKDFMAQPQQLSDADADQYWWPLHEGANRPMRHIAGNFDGVMAQFPRYQGYLKSFDGPVFLLWGTQDKVLRYDRIGSQFQRDMKIGKERTRPLEAASHFVQEDAPQAVSETILQMIATPAPQR